jgi:tetratricopeptide (TPR) repeat protein
VKIIELLSFKTLLATVLVGLLGLNSMNVVANSSDSDAPESKSMDSARKALDDGDYATAIGHLKQALDDDSQSANALNLMGYSLRKSGKLDQAFDFYQKALDIEPEHLGANEYLGELYLQRDELDKAEQRLALLDEACFLPCEEYTELKEAIAEYRKRKGLN